MKVRVTLEVDHKHLDNLKAVIDHSAGFARTIEAVAANVEADARQEAGEPAVVVAKSSGKGTNAQSVTKSKPKAEEAKTEKPQVDKPNVHADEVRAAMLAYSKEHGTESAIKVLKCVGKVSKVKDVEPENFAALIDAFSGETPF